MLTELINQAFSPAFSQSGQLRNTSLFVLAQLRFHQLRNMEGQGHLSEANQPLQSPHPEPPILLGSQTQCHYSLPPIPQRLPDNSGQPHAPGPVKVIQTSQSWARFPGRALSFPRRPHKGSCPHFPFASSASSPALMFPWVAPVGWGAPSSWKLWVSNHLSNGNYFLIC